MADNRQNDRNDHTGPFPQQRGARRPWENREREGPYERRRTDRRNPPSAGRGKSVTDKLKTPLIGLTLAGLAVPLVNAGVNPAAVEKRASEKEADAADAAASARDLDEGVGDYWADAEEAAVRGHTIEGAVTRYDIDARLAEKIYDAATAHGIEPDIAYGLVFTESTFRERAVSHVGARGLTQLMPRTAKWLNPGVTVRDLYNPDVNLDIGFKYLRQLIDKYEGNIEHALTAYNRGPGTVDRILDRGGNPDNGYAGKVLAG